MMLITGMLISGKMSVAMFHSANGVARTISSAITMNVYGRRSASWTMDIVGSGWLEESAYYVMVCFPRVKTAAAPCRRSKGRRRSGRLAADRLGRLLHFVELRPQPRQFHGADPLRVRVVELPLVRLAP